MELIVHENREGHEFHSCRPSFGKISALAPVVLCDRVGNPARPTSSWKSDPLGPRKNETKKTTPLCEDRLQAQTPRCDAAAGSDHLTWSAPQGPNKPRRPSVYSSRFPCPLK